MSKKWRESVHKKKDVKNNNNEKTIYKAQPEWHKEHVSLSLSVRILRFCYS